MSGEWAAGKGDKTRPGADLRKYWEADYWKELEAKKLSTKTEQTSAECVSPDKSKESS